jgi:hypothetical protein
MAKEQTSIRLSGAAKALLKAVSRHLGISQTGVIELAIRDIAKTSLTRKDVNSLIK